MRNVPARLLAVIVAATGAVSIGATAIAIRVLDRYPFDRDSWAVVFALGTFLSTFVYGFFAAGQWLATRRQAARALRANRIARQNLESAHRAWLMITWADIDRSVNPDGRIVIRWTLWNPSDRPATRASLAVAPSWIGDPDISAPAPSPPEATIIVAPGKEFPGLCAIAPNDGGRFTNADLDSVLGASPPQVHLQLTATYWDGFRSQTTRVCFLWEARVLLTPKSGPPRQGAFVACLDHEHVAT